MILRYVLTASMLFFASFAPAAAQIQKDEQTSKIVEGATRDLFDVLNMNNFESEHALMADELASIYSLESWKTAHMQIVDSAGLMAKYIAYRTTFYEDTPFAAVDFYGQADKPNTFICGFVVWKIADNKIGFVRIERNVVSVSTFKRMPLQQAAQLMADWRCPISLIQKVLDL